MTQVTQVNIGVDKNPGCLIQLVWWLLIGWWAGLAWVIIAWSLMLTVIFLPAGIWMINRISQVIALRSPRQTLQVTTVGGATIIKQGADQVNILLRIVWFFVVGIILSAVWMLIAYSMCLTVIFMPVGFWMFDKTPAVLTLQR
jgi:uncharacterized membrane protein YccF (DUF307 family)